jgi:hypothetical protein
VHLTFVEDRPFDVFFRAKLVIGKRHRPDVPHPGLDVRTLVAGRQVIQFENAEEVVAELDQHAFPETRRLYGRCHDCISFRS